MEDHLHQLRLADSRRPIWPLVVLAQNGHRASFFGAGADFPPRRSSYQSFSSQSFSQTFELHLPTVSSLLQFSLYLSLSLSLPVSLLVCFLTWLLFCLSCSSRLFCCQALSLSLFVSLPAWNFIFLFCCFSVTTVLHINRMGEFQVSFVICCEISYVRFVADASAAKAPSFCRLRERE